MESKGIRRKACRWANKCTKKKKKALFITFPLSFIILLCFLFFLKSFEPALARQRPCRLHQFNTGIHWSRSNLFVSLFVCFSHCFHLYTFLFMAFSSVSVTLAIFRLVAPNMPLCLSAVTMQLIYINAGSDNR